MSICKEKRLSGVFNHRSSMGQEHCRVFASAHQYQFALEFQCVLSTISFLSEGPSVKNDGQSVVLR